MDKKIRVLQWDDTDYHTSTLEQEGVEVETIKLEVWAGHGYRVFPEKCAEARRLTEAGEVDLVILGNNMGTGIANARFIADAMKERTVVVWNDYLEGKEVSYLAMGFKHFGSRCDLEKIIPAVLGIQ